MKENKIYLLVFVVVFGLTTTILYTSNIMKSLQITNTSRTQAISSILGEGEIDIFWDIECTNQATNIE